MGFLVGIISVVEVVFLFTAFLPIRVVTTLYLQVYLSPRAHTRFPYQTRAHVRSAIV
jgi:hypothetical protein